MEQEARHKKVADPVASSESLTTSTESESFETWTLVTEAKKNPTKGSLETEKPLDEEDHVELIEKDDNNKRDNENVDDLSDGISIISDNESAGRNSPNPLMGESAGDRHFPLITEISSDFESSIKHIKYEPLTPPASPRQIEVCCKVENQVIDKDNTEQERPSSEQNSPPLLGFGVRGVFLASILIAISAFIAKTKYPEWEQLSLTSKISPLTQRIEDLELQNNLLRAEIDLLNKQVKYLTEQKGKSIQKDEIKDPYRQDEKQNEAKTRGGAKVWSGSSEEPTESYFKASNREYNKPKDSGPNNNERQYTDKNADLKKDTNAKEFNEQRQVKEERKYDRERRSYENPHKFHEDEYAARDEKYDKKYSKHDNGKNVERENWKKDYNSKEHYPEDSHEKYRKQRKRQWDHDQSREQYNNKRWKGDDDWHEKMMQHREETRKKQDQHNSNNWYIERGSSREEARVIDKGNH